MLEDLQRENAEEMLKLGQQPYQPMVLPRPPFNYSTVGNPGIASGPQTDYLEKFKKIMDQNQQEMINMKKRMDEQAKQHQEIMDLVKTQMGQAVPPQFQRPPPPIKQGDIKVREEKKMMNQGPKQVKKPVVNQEPTGRPKPMMTNDKSNSLPMKAQKTAHEAAKQRPQMTMKTEDNMTKKTGTGQGAPVNSQDGAFGGARRKTTVNQPRKTGNTAPATRPIPGLVGGDNIMVGPTYADMAARHQRQQKAKATQQQANRKAPRPAGASALPVDIQVHEGPFTENEFQRLSWYLQQPHIPENMAPDFDYLVRKHQIIESNAKEEKYEEELRRAEVLMSVQKDQMREQEEELQQYRNDNMVLVERMEIQERKHMDRMKKMQEKTQQAREIRAREYQEAKKNKKEQHYKRREFSHNPSVHNPKTGDSSFDSCSGTTESDSDDSGTPLGYGPGHQIRMLKGGRRDWHPRVQCPPRRTLFNSESGGELPSDSARRRYRGRARGAATMALRNMRIVPFPLEQEQEENPRFGRDHPLGKDMDFIRKLSDNSYRGKGKQRHKLHYFLQQISDIACKRTLGANAILELVKLVVDDESRDHMDDMIALHTPASTIWYTLQARTQERMGQEEARSILIQIQQDPRGFSLRKLFETVFSAHMASQGSRHHIAGQTSQQIIDTLINIFQTHLPHSVSNFIIKEFEEEQTMPGYNVSKGASYLFIIADKELGRRFVFRTANEGIMKANLDHFRDHKAVLYPTYNQPRSQNSVYNQRGGRRHRGPQPWYENESTNYAMDYNEGLYQPRQNYNQRNGYRQPRRPQNNGPRYEERQYEERQYGYRPYGQNYGEERRNPRYPQHSNNSYNNYPQRFQQTHLHQQEMRGAPTNPIGQSGNQRQNPGPVQVRPDHTRQSEKNEELELAIYQQDFQATYQKNGLDKKTVLMLSRRFPNTCLKCGIEGHLGLQCPTHKRPMTAFPCLCGWWHVDAECPRDRTKDMFTRPPPAI